MNEFNSFPRCGDRKMAGHPDPIKGVSSPIKFLPTSEKIA
jgi:hypothetical protein